MINGTPFQYIIVALIISSISITITQSSLFKSFRDAMEDMFTSKLFNCPYCLAHWLAFPFIWMFGIGIFAVIGLSAIFSLPIIVYLEKLDA